MAKKKTAHGSRGMRAVCELNAQRATRKCLSRKRTAAGEKACWDKFWDVRDACLKKNTPRGKSRVKRRGPRAIAGCGCGK